jgi:hypothetical protein
MKKFTNNSEVSEQRPEPITSEQEAKVPKIGLYSGVHDFTTVNLN